MNVVTLFTLLGVFEEICTEKKVWICSVVRALVAQWSICSSNPVSGTNFSLKNINRSTLLFTPDYLAMCCALVKLCWLSWSILSNKELQNFVKYLCWQSKIQIYNRTFTKLFGTNASWKADVCLSIKRDVAFEEREGGNSSDREQKMEKIASGRSAVNDLKHWNVRSLFTHVRMPSISVQNNLNVDLEMMKEQNITSS